MSDRLFSPLFDDFWYPSHRHRHHQHRTNPWNQLEALMDMGNKLSSMDRDLDSACQYFGYPRQNRNYSNNNNRAGLEFFSPSVESHQDGAVSATGQEGKYTMNVPLGGNIGPEDLKVSLKEEEGLKIMEIQAKKEHKSEDGTQRYYYEMSRKFNLPSSVDPAQVKTVLTPQGFLRVEAPLSLPPSQKQIEQAKPREIPITMK
jgi:HSP20 family molecular chaperone IbpA